ncbi:unnamed protein product [Sphagnum balticum]
MGSAVMAFSTTTPESLMTFSVWVLLSSLLAFFITEFILNLNGSSYLSQKPVRPSQTITFKDVYGLERPKEVLQETIDFLKNPGRYEEVGCRLRRGIIFYGPPGTGKTLLAKATAGETNSFFISCSASEFCEKYVGMGAKRYSKISEYIRKKNEDSKIKRTLYLRNKFVEGSFSSRRISDHSVLSIDTCNNLKMLYEKNSHGMSRGRAKYVEALIAFEEDFKRGLMEREYEKLLEHYLVKARE